MEKKSVKGWLTRSLAIAPSLLLAVGCSGGGGGSGSADLNSLSAATSAKIGIFMEADTSAAPSAKRVIVNVDTVTIKSEAGDSITGVSLNKEVELTSNEVALPNITLDEGQSLQSREIRLVLNELGNKYIKEDGTVCELKTPSGQQSGLKIKLPESLSIQSGLRYSIHLAFDVEKSIVEQGNGGCLLKPVIKGEIIVYRPPVVDDGSDNDDGDSDTGTDPGTGGGSDDGSTGGDDGSSGDDGSTGGDTGTDDGTEDGSGDDDVQPIEDVVYQPESNQVVDIIQVEVSN